MAFKNILLLFTVALFTSISASEIDSDEELCLKELATATNPQATVIGKVRSVSAPIASSLIKKELFTEKKEFLKKQAARDANSPQREFCGNAEGPGGERAKALRLETPFKNRSASAFITHSFSIPATKIPETDDMEL